MSVDNPLEYDEAPMEAPQPNTFDFHNDTYYCGNCSCPRSINDRFEVETCRDCGDDEFDICFGEGVHGLP